MDNKKFIITLDCRAEDRNSANDYITSLLYGPTNGSKLAEEFNVTVDYIFVDEDDY